MKSITKQGSMVTYLKRMLARENAACEWLREKGESAVTEIIINTT